MSALQNRPIGVFDSGLGGLTAVRELRSILPGEDIIFFGDTGRVPYGSRGRDTILRYTRQDIAFLLSHGVKTVIAACGTASSTLPPEEGAALPVGYSGVVAPAARAARAATKNGVIGVIGTEATVRSGSYQRALGAEVQSITVACPLFVPLVENGHFAADDEMVRLACDEYLGPLRDAEADTVLMGCTHYPLLAGALRRWFGDGVSLIDSGREAALAQREALAAAGLLQNRTEGGRAQYFVSDHPARFEAIARLFLGKDEVAGATRVDIEEYSLEAVAKT